jgi:hydroxymethylglutaryl-CoA reductase (NADPH)
VTVDRTRARKFIEYLRSLLQDPDWEKRLQPKVDPAPTSIPRGTSSEDMEKRWRVMNAPPSSRQEIADARSHARVDEFSRNVENYIGTITVPVGIAGPLRVNGLFAQGDFYIPLATTEAALVASYNRGARAITEAGGASALLTNEGISRAPGYAFARMHQAVDFATWVLLQFNELRKVAEKTTRFGKLVDARVNLEGNHVYVTFDFFSADASGQNMSTIATEAIHQYILDNCPITPEYHFIEANFSSDKKASSLSFQTVRGRKVSADVVLPRKLVEERLNTTPQKVTRYYQFSTLGCVQSGTIGTEGHYANALAALYIATGQDAACVAESAVGVTRFEITDSGDLYASVTMPNLMVATVGGGTGLPAQKACLDILGLYGPGNAHAFAEVVAATCLAGEVSIAAALSAGEFTRAHETLARGKERKPSS